MNSSGIIATITGLALGGLLGGWHELVAAGLAPSPASPQAQPVDRGVWARKLVALNEADWRTAFEVGQELAALPANDGLAILKANWEKIGKVDARQQLLKAWYFAMPYPLRIRNHPRLLDGLDLGMRDRSPEVQRWAMGYLGGLAFQDFSEDFPAYKAWYQANRDKPVPEVVAQSVRQFATEAARSVKSDAPKRARWLAEHMNVMRRHAQGAPGGAGRRTLADPRSLGGRCGGRVTTGRNRARRPCPAGDRTAQAGRGGAAARGDAIAREGEAGGSEGRGERGAGGQGEYLGHRSSARRAQGELGGRCKRHPRDRLGGGRSLASIDDPRVIPTMIAVIDSDNTYDTIYGVGYFGLGRLTSVQYDESHDGAWWRRWWEKNKERYPEAVRALAIPKLPKKPQLAEQAPADPLADVADILAQHLHAGGDDKKRYFLIGPKDAKPPAAGYGLLIVLPGGDGSADFQPFVRRMHKSVLRNRWLIAQAVAPKWDEIQCAPCKGVGLQWVQFPPGKLVAPASSYRSGGGGNKTVGAFETNVSPWRCSEQAGRNLSERRAGLEKSNVCADLALIWGRP